MVINYLGGECFKVSFGDTTIAFNPISKESSWKEARFGADVAFVSLNHPDFNGTSQMSYGDREAFVVNGPGEYEVGDVTALGFGVPTTYDGAPAFNTIYYVTLEGINLLFLGALSDAKIDPKILESLGDIDILFAPVGGGDVLDAASASALGVKLEPHIIIPMHYNEKTLAEFLKEEGVTAVPEEKLTLKKKDLLPLEGQIVVLKS